jgi:hypothetical protein
MENNLKTNDFTPEASLKVIFQMIESTRAKIGRNYFYFLFWGYLVVLTCLVEYLLIMLVGYPKHYLVWPVFMTAGTLITAIYAFKEHTLTKSRTYIGTTMGYLWVGWFISFSLLILFVNLQNEYSLILPMVLAMYGLGIFVSAGVLSFKPLFIGATISWAGSVVAYFVDYPYQLIVMAVVVIFSHIIPGHILKNKSKD